MMNKYHKTKKNFNKRFYFGLPWISDPMFLLRYTKEIAPICLHGYYEKYLPTCEESTKLLLLKDLTGGTILTAPPELWNIQYITIMPNTL